MDRLPVTENPALFGSDPKEGIVAVEMSGGSNVRVFVRTDGGLAAEDDSFEPFLLLESPALLSGCPGAPRFEALEGSRVYRALAFFTDWRALQAALTHLRKVTGKTPGVPDGPFFFISDPVQQYLTVSGRTLYKGLRFEDVVRLQLDIETTVTEGFEFPNAERDGDRITLISLCDSTGWEHTLRGDTLGEPEMCLALNRILSERDPDIVEGHNLFNFDLPYLEARAARYGLTLDWGRDGSAIQGRASRFTAAERTINYKRFDIHGRQVVDTLFLVQLYDVGTRELESFGLKQVARHLGVASEDRTYLDRSEIPSLFEKDMERLTAYGLDDVRETREISRILGQSHFYQTQMFPLSHQNAVVRGTATKIDSLLLREYVRRRQSIPKPPEPASFPGGYTDLLLTGVVSPVVNCDVQSLYPSVMLTFGIHPSRDDLGVFPRLLSDLTRWRLEAKAQMKGARSQAQRAFYDALQSTFKILINSFYGYLGFPLGHFADFDAAAQVTAQGRRLICEILDKLRAKGALPIEVDTDGVYFVPPAGLTTPESEHAFVADISDELPEGIQLDTGGRYRAMFSYKVKNYVLLKYDGELVVRGSGLRSRGIEKFQRRFMQEMFRALLEGRPEDVPSHRKHFLEELRNHRWTPDEFAKTETLHDSLDTYLLKRQKSKRNASAAYEIALASGRPYQPGDQVTYYVTGTKKSVRVFEAAKPVSLWDPDKPDENVEYYAKKLEDLYKKFLPFVRTAAEGQLDLGV